MYTECLAHAILNGIIIITLQEFTRCTSRLYLLLLLHLKRFGLPQFERKLLPELFGEYLGNLLDIIGNFSFLHGQIKAIKYIILINALIKSYIRNIICEKKCYL
jgi:hypothetical protein